MGSSSLTGTADGMGRGKRELGERAIRGKNNQEKRRIVSVQGLSSPGQQRVRAGGDPALLARLPWLLRVRDLLGQALEKKTEQNLFIVLWFVTGKKGRGCLCSPATAPAPGLRRVWSSTGDTNTECLSLTNISCSTWSGIKLPGDTGVCEEMLR